MSTPYVPSLEQVRENAAVEPVKSLENYEPRASIFTVEQEAELRRLKACLPYRTVWGAVNVQTEPHTFEAHASYTRHRMNRYIRKGWLVATIG